MEIVIKKGQDSILDAVGGMINGGLFIAVAIYFFNRNTLLAFFLICGSIRFSVYQMIDLWTDKTIFVVGNKLFIKWFGIKFKLDTSRSYLMIENMLVLNPINAKYPTLNIYRNSATFLGRLFKNRIKLYTVTKDNIEESRRNAQKLSAMFEIAFKDVYDFD